MCAQELRQKTIVANGCEKEGNCGILHAPRYQNVTKVDVSANSGWA